MAHPSPTVDEAIAFICETLRQPDLTAMEQRYGYAVYVPALVKAWIRLRPGGNAGNSHQLDAAGAPFLDAVWELHQRGYLRPGLASITNHSTQGSASGLGYSLTPRGREWLHSGEDVPRSASALAQAFHALASRFGRAFALRAQEAVACLQAGVPLAACAMAGAAAEAILLAVATARDGDRDAVMRSYRAASGRKQVTDRVLGQAPQWLKERMTPGLELLTYWRDDAAHGAAEPIAAPLASLAIDRLYRLATVVDAHWAELVGRQDG